MATFTNTSGQRVTTGRDKNGKKTKTVTGPVTNTDKVGSIVNGKKVGYRVGGRSYEKASDAPGYNDTFQGKGTRSAGRDIYGNTVGGVINAEVIKPNTPLVIPKPQVTDVPDFVANYAGLTGGETGMSTTGNQITVDPVKEDKNASIMQQFLDNQQSIYDDRTTGADVYRQVEKESGIKKYRAEENNLAGQLNTITANRDAAVLSLEGQGRGQTEGFIGGEQARINREAAIKALPIQAQLATAQGNVALAQDHINTWGKILMDDANNEYNHRQSVNQSILTFLNDAEKRRLDAIQKQDDRAYAEKTNNITYQRNLASQAAEYGLGSISSSIMKLDPNSPTFSTEIASLQGQVRKPIVATEVKRETQFNANGDLVDMQTGEIITKAGGGVGSTEERQKTLDQISFLQTTIKDAENLADATGPNMITKGVGNLFVGNTRVKQLATKLDTLKTNLLTLNSDPALKKFFGPQMTEKDTQLLMSAGSTLNAYDATEADNKAELTRYSELLNRMKTAVNNGGITWGVTLTGADGLQYVITD